MAERPPRTAFGTEGHPPTGRLSPGDRDLLLHLLDLPTAGPLETAPTAEPDAPESARPTESRPPESRPPGPRPGAPVRAIRRTTGRAPRPGGAETPELWAAGRAYAAAAAEFGMDVVRHAAAPARALRRDDVPLTVREAVRHRPGFLECQPSLVLRLGPELPPAATVMFNVHLDTVAGWWPPGFDGRRFTGRGAIDAKGPAVALLAGIRAARSVEPSLGERVGVLVQAVAGEEGGAMGTFGTRLLVEQGYVGRLNLFCEPTGHRYLPRSTASMTARVRVRGEDAVDDRPDAGHNATVLLGYLSQHLAREVPGKLTDARLCVAGLHTGDRHNRVYGSGQLLVNIAYGTREAGRAAQIALRDTLEEGLAAFQTAAADTADLARTAVDAPTITFLDWYKRDLPALDGRVRDAWAETLLAEAGVDRWPADEPAFTCDAIWMAGLEGGYTAVFGPGGLATNRAHATGEYAELSELDRYADQVAHLLVAFARSGAPPASPGVPPAGVAAARAPAGPAPAPCPNRPEPRYRPETRYPSHPSHPSHPTDVPNPAFPVPPSQPHDPEGSTEPADPRTAGPGERTDPSTNRRPPR